jgi:predicted NAD/FAD-binding protein
VRIAIVGGGAAGLLSAWLLQDDHEVTVFERAPVLGGHARTITVEHAGKTVHCETGFKYFFAANYPVMMALLDLFGLRPRPRWLTLSICRLDGSTLVLPPRSPRQIARLLVSPRLLVDLLRLERFLRSGGKLVARKDWSLTLRRYLEARGHSQAWADELVYPTLAANWGTSVSEIADFPAYSMLKVLTRSRGQGNRFLELEGGISAYINRLVYDLRRVALRTGVGVAKIDPRDGAVFIESDRGETERFDQVILASSARDAARLTAEIPAARRWHEVLSGFRHFDTTIAIHGDLRLMPKRRADWSLVNVFHEGDGQPWQTEWCGIAEGAPVFRTWLRPGASRPEPLYQLLEFHHLIVGIGSHGLQQRIAALQGEARLWAAGMYATDVDNHESALASTLPIARALAPRSPNLARLERRLRE